MAMFGVKKPLALGSVDPMEMMTPQMFGGAALPDIQSVGSMPRFSYRGPEIAGRDRLRGIAAALDDMGGGNAFETFMGGQDKRQRGDYDAAMGGLDTLQQREPIDRLTAGMGQDERDLFQIAPELALKRMYSAPKEDEFDFKDGYLFNKRTGMGKQVAPQVRTSSPGAEYWVQDPVTGMPKVVGSNKNFAPNRSRPASSPTLGQNEQWEE